MILETEKLILRPFKETDAAAVYEYAKDDRVGPIAGWPPHISVEQSKEIIQTIFNQEGVFAVTLKNTDKVIGMISLIVGQKVIFLLQRQKPKYHIGWAYHFGVKASCQKLLKK